MRLERQVAIVHGVGSSEERRHNARVATEVALCRIVTATCFLFSALFGVATIASRGTSRTEVTRATVRAFAFEAFPRWTQQHQDEACPQSIAELSIVLGREDARDAWDHELELRCGDGVRGAYVRSPGADGAFDTRDDITSND